MDFVLHTGTYGINSVVKGFCNSTKKEISLGKITISGLSPDTNEEDLREAFFKFGEIEEIKIPRDKNTNKPKGIGFVFFKTEEGSSSAAMEMEGADLNGREITVNVASGR